MGRKGHSPCFLPYVHTQLSTDLMLKINCYCSLVLWIKGIYRSSPICYKFTKQRQRQPIKRLQLYSSPCRGGNCKERSEQEDPQYCRQQRSNDWVRKTTKQGEIYLLHQRQGHTRGNLRVALTKKWTFIRKQSNTIYKICPVGHWHILFLKTSLTAASMITC